MSEATISRGNWFDDLCAEKGLIALDPVYVEDITPGNYLFDIFGSPRQVLRVRHNKKTTRLFFQSHSELWNNGDIISFYAKKKPRTILLSEAGKCVSCDNARSELAGKDISRYCGPPHDASERCNSGKRNHCTCEEACF